MTKKTCSIEGCEKPVFARGWCCSHYKRWKRHGDPLGGATYHGEVLNYLNSVVLPYAGEECLLWPFATTKGYGRAWIGGNYVDVHRWICEVENGPPPLPNMDAAHSCGRGHEGCVTRKHLSWKVRMDNCNDTVRHERTTRGKKNAMAKLDEKAVREIRSLTHLSERELGVQFGISATQAGCIRRRKSWAWLK